MSAITSSCSHPVAVNPRLFPDYAAGSSHPFGVAAEANASASLPPLSSVSRLQPLRLWRVIAATTDVWLYGGEWPRHFFQCSSFEILFGYLKQNYQRLYLHMWSPKLGPKSDRSLSESLGQKTFDLWRTWKVPATVRSEGDLTQWTRNAMAGRIDGYYIHITQHTQFEIEHPLSMENADTLSTSTATHKSSELSTLRSPNGHESLVGSDSVANTSSTAAQGQAASVESLWVVIVWTSCFPEGGRLFSYDGLSEYHFVSAEHVNDQSIRASIAEGRLLPSLSSSEWGYLARTPQLDQLTQKKFLHVEEWIPPAAIIVADE
jgi:hypothetical protein